MDDHVEPGPRAGSSSTSAWSFMDQTEVNDIRLPRVEKDADDPTNPPSSHTAPQQRQSTSTTLSRLFAVQAATSPETSRHTSFLSPQHPRSYSRAVQAETAALPDHLYSRGLLSGKHSDIVVHAFGQQYKLHRLILDRSPFFATALSEPWLEAQASEMSVHPEDIDSAIDQPSFELALRRLYGCFDLAEEDQNPAGLFATACWLEMKDLVASTIDSMLRQMNPDNLAHYIRLVTTNYYGNSGGKILASAKSMLCRDGWQMPLRFWDGIPGDIIREIVGGDGFFVEGEMDRWLLAKRILDRRLKVQATAADLVDPSSHKVLKAPEAASLMAVRFDAVYRNSAANGRGVSDSFQKWLNLYTHPEIEPLLVLLDEGIHYVHLDFEQLQFIRRSKDVLGLPMVPEKVVTTALWQAMELRQSVLNARDGDLELGLGLQCTDASPEDAGRDTTMSILASSESQRPKGKRKVSDNDNPESDIDSGSWDGNGKPRKFWIPNSDCNIVMGGNSLPIIATANSTVVQRHASRLSATIQPEDVQWASDFMSATSRSGAAAPPSDDAVGNDIPEYTKFPPFRFSAEFPNARLLKEKKRVYSRTVFYAGSLWNIYIQKVASSRSKQLGVYLHRAKERETEEVIAGTAGLAQGSVDERIGQLERELILRGERRDRRHRRRMGLTNSDPMDGDGTESSGSTGLDDAGPSDQGTTARVSRMRGLLAQGHRKSGQTDVQGSSPTTGLHTHHVPPYDDDNDDDDESLDSETEDLAATASSFHVPTLPPYVDARPTIKTYFKIYSPSRGGRMLSVYESAPDKFNFSQSWGWKSSTLMLDEGFLGEDDGVDELGGGEQDGSRRVMRGKGDGRLRFMVVIGNI
ncbi:unnamed protein product [Zymoseptoria tritici ST99CH_3D1]|uniref:BTB domain-containing protein n=1 Tax=Zymoseptoria tritici (strain ST99CH_3D7) TaxID=1276538 RepID=A0A1X7RFP7_ZYMT9|nr:unnamed protein product [Zymoseptoria tritici ST99CH_3D7]SMR44749.1 unnamed protein product [Zymoseptoria tritici ST99CH_3D1]